nr:hybrid signal transduction histidine kinase M [Tanacetum cinerariifolium]
DKQDDLVKVWILITLEESLQDQVVTTPGNAKALWDHIKDLFHDNKDARAITLDGELRSIKLGSLTINAYCTKIKAMADRLANLREKVSDKNLVMYALNGLDTRPTPTTAVAHPPPSLCSGDLYPVTKPSTIPTALLSTSSSTWHQRLGHPGDEVLWSLASRQFISCNKEKSSHVCHACQLGKHVKLPFHNTPILTQSPPPPPPPLQTDPQTHTEPTTLASPTPINSPQLN